MKLDNNAGKVHNLKGIAPITMVYNNVDFCKYVRYYNRDIAIRVSLNNYYEGV